MTIQDVCFHHPKKEELVYILKNNFSHTQKAMSAHLLLGKEPTNAELCAIIEYAPPKWKIIAAKALLEKKPNGEEICFILKYGMEESQKQAAEIIFKDLPYKDYLMRVIKYAPFKIKISAAEILLQLKDVGNDELQVIISLKHPIKDLAIEKAFSLIPNNSTLHVIIDHGNEDQKNRAEKILEKRFFKKKK